MFFLEVLTVSNQTIQVDNKQLNGDGNTILSCRHSQIVGNKNIISNGEDVEIWGNYNMCLKMKKCKVVGNRNIIRGEEITIKGDCNAVTGKEVFVIYGVNNVWKQPPPPPAEEEKKEEEEEEENLGIEVFFFYFFFIF